MIHGVGVNDADYVVQKKSSTYINGKQKQKLLWMCPYYKTWRNMITRCYSEKWKEKYPTYRGCEVCDEWLIFSNFRCWMESQQWEHKQLDKDLLSDGFCGKLYSPDTCVFIDKKLNTFMLDCGVRERGGLVGAQFKKDSGCYQAQCHNPFTKKREYLGLFPTAESAHEAWRQRKDVFAQRLADSIEDPRLKAKLREMYSIS